MIKMYFWGLISIALFILMLNSPLWGLVAIIGAGFLNWRSDYE